MFSMSIGIHRKKEARKSINFEQIIHNLETVYNFHSQCVMKAREYLQVSENTQMQGPNGTVSQITMDDQAK
jgi:hypothetical protein